MWFVIITKDNIVEDMHEFDNEENAKNWFLLECKVIDENIERLDREDLLNDGHYTNLCYGVSLWTPKSQ